MKTIFVAAMQYQRIDKDVKFGLFGKVEDVPVTGDWNGDGRDEAGYREPCRRYFYLDNDSDGLWEVG